MRTLGKFKRSYTECIFAFKNGRHKALECEKNTRSRDLVLCFLFFFNLSSTFLERCVTCEALEKTRTQQSKHVHLACISIEKTMEKQCSGTQKHFMCEWHLMQQMCPGPSAQVLRLCIVLFCLLNCSNDGYLSELSCGVKGWGVKGWHV